MIILLITYIVCIITVGTRHHRCSFRAVNDMSSNYLRNLVVLT